MSSVKKFVIRLDDVGSDAESGECNLIRKLCDRGLALTCAVVPRWLTRRSTRTLRQLAEHYPGAIEFHQHGWSHSNYAPPLETENKHEFGGVRPRAEQESDILQGRAILESSFAGFFTSVFTPPYGAFDDVTASILSDHGFAGISACPWSREVPFLPDLTPHVDCCIWNPPGEKHSATIEAEWQMDPTRGIHGFILHPRWSSTDATVENICTLTESGQSSLFSSLLQRSDDDLCRKSQLQDDRPRTI
ncbi:MAG TPA: DUF2334 domain-containing protein [Candidatus Angelobacter sp.]|jgi:hypothetical protein